MTGKQHRRSVNDRARRRAVRAYAASLGIPYTAAARLLAAGKIPLGINEHRAWLFAMREQRSYALRLRDTRMAVDIPLGRAAHLTERFPPLRLSAQDALYDGERRQVTLGLLYALLRHETPTLVPAADELSWVAELGEETAIDFVLANLDRAARLCLEEDSWQLWARMEAALAAGEAGEDRRVRDAAITLSRDFRTMIPRRSLSGARDILDAVLTGAYGGYPPGTHVRILTGPLEGSPATVVGACWQRQGPPTHYRVRADAITVVLPPEEVAPLEAALA